MKISLTFFLIICLIFFCSINISSCLRTDSSTTETDNNNSDGRCEFAKTNASQNSIVPDNQSQKAFRLLLQSTFGPQKKDLDRVIQIGETSWIDEQLKYSSAYDAAGDNLTTNLEHYKIIARMAEPSTYSDNTSSFNNNFHGRTSDYQSAAWFEKALHAPDQLRYRVAFALSELLVVSGAKQRTRFRGDSLAYYDDILTKNAFGYFRDLLDEVT